MQVEATGQADRLLAAGCHDRRLDRAFRLATPLGALHQAVSYRSIVASQQPPIDVHMGRSTAWWLRQLLAGLADVGPPP